METNVLDSVTLNICRHDVTRTLRAFCHPQLCTTLRGCLCGISRQSMGGSARISQLWRTYVVNNGRVVNGWVHPLHH